MNIFLTLVFAILLACSFVGCSGSTGDSDADSSASGESDSGASASDSDSGSASLAPSDLTSKIAGDVELPR